MGPHTAHSRDSALRRLAMSNRWLIAGSVALTGVLSELAAHAFPGKTLKSGGSQSAVHKGTTTVKYHSQHSSQGSSSSLRAPAQAPRAAAPEQSKPVQAAPETPVVSGGS